MAILLFLVISYILLSLSLYKVFEKAGEDGWKALVPGLNFWIWSRLVGRNPLHSLWLLFPIVNLFIFIGLAIDLVRSFGRYSLLDSALAFIYAPLAFFLIGRNPNDKYQGPTLVAERQYSQEMEEAIAKNDTRTFKKLEAKNPYKKSQAREWLEAIVFAVFAAAFIRMFLIEAYTIPTSSMEGSLMVGDFLFVSKAHYGIRTPQTVIMVPLLHNRLPVLDRESYLSKPNIPFTRLPALESIDRNDPVVFNYPEGDSVYIFPQRTFSVYDVRRGALAGTLLERQIQTGNKKLVVRPIDKKDHYIKRCVAVAGDTIQVVDRQLFINGKPADNPTNIQFKYLVLFPEPINTNNFSAWGISPEDQGVGYSDNNPNGPNHMLLVLSEDQKQKIQQMDARIQFIPNSQYLIPGAAGKMGSLKKAGVTQAHVRYSLRDGSGIFTLDQALVDSIRSVDSTILVRTLDEADRLFPHDPEHFKNQNVDNYGPVWIPKKGATITLTPANIALYRRVISVYEHNNLEEKDGKFTINGVQTNQYTFKQDYFWMMGDNRHNSEDSRVWGFVPHDHVVGKPLFIWLSLKEGSMANGIAWDRLFTSADKR